MNSRKSKATTVNAKRIAEVEERLRTEAIVSVTPLRSASRIRRKTSEPTSTRLHSQFCVYTIKDAKQLSRLTREGTACQFKERKSWVTAEELERQARDSNEAMPVLFGDAADCSRLLFWGILTDVHVEEDGSTSFAVDYLRRLNGKHAPQELVLRSSGKHIAPDFIKPYAICLTPQFLSKTQPLAV